MLASPSQFSAGRVASLNEVLAAGAKSSLDLPAGAAAVRALELRLETDDLGDLERALRSVIVKLTFDHEVTAWCPATDFFGTAVGLNELRSWYRHVGADGSMRCRWVMPYSKTARVTLLNVGSQPVRAELHATVSPWAWDKRSLHFHAAWHQESGLKTPPVSDWNFIRISGRGVYAGDSLAIFNPVATWYGEGDEKIWVDGESFPSHLGTGTEDYYGYSYAPKPVHQTPFSNLVRIDQPMTQGWNVMSRTRNLDGIPFRKSLQFDMELMSWVPTMLTYAATTYWYAFPGAASNLKPQLKEAALPVPTLAGVQAHPPPSSAPAPLPQPSRKPGAVECETLKVLAKAGDIFVGEQDMGPFGGERWSNGRQLLVKAGKVGDFVDLEVPAPDDQPRRVVLYATQAPDFGVLSFSINGKACAATLDGYESKVQPSVSVKLGVFAPRDGKFRLRIEVVGANPAAKDSKYFFGLDCLILERP